MTTKTETRIAAFADKVGVSIDQARATVTPLDGLTDEQFVAHTRYFAERKGIHAGKVIASAAVPPPSPATPVAAEHVHAWMSEYLDAENPEVYNQAVPPPVDDLTSVGEEIVAYFASADLEEKDEV